MRFCYSWRWNDHFAYPMSLAEAPPGGWRYRPTAVEFDRRLGRPWAHFHRRRHEIVHASSLIPTNDSPWLLDTDHVDYLLQQATDAAGGTPGARDREAIAERLRHSLSDRRCLGLIAWSEAARRSVEELFGGTADLPRILVAVPPVVPPPTSPDARARVDALLGSAPRDTLRLLAVDGQRGVCTTPGRKNVMAAIECLDRLTALGIEAELFVVAPLEPVVPRPGLHVLPFLSRSEMWELYRRSDVFLFLSRQDSFGYALLEAMSNGVCCVATAGGSVPVTSEIIESGRNGVLIPFHRSRPYPEASSELDMTSLVSAVARLAYDAEYRRHLARSSASDFAPGGRFGIDRRNRLLSEWLAEVLPCPMGYDVRSSRCGAGLQPCDASQRDWRP